MYAKQDYLSAYRLLRVSRSNRVCEDTRNEIERSLRSNFSPRTLRAIAYSWSNRG